MGYVGAGFVVNQANTTDGGAINTVAYASTGASAGQYVGGAYAVNLYTGPFGTLSLDFINNYYAIAGVSNTFSQVITFSRASNATRFAPDGVLQYAPHNLLLQSQTFDNAAWTKSGLNTTGTPAWVDVAVAPNGTITADKLTEDTATSAHTVASASIAATSQSYTFSIFAKKAERTFIQLFGRRDGTNYNGVSVNLDTGAVSAPTRAATSNNASTTTVIDVGNGWWRIAMTYTYTTTGNTVVFAALGDATNTYSYTGDGTSGIYIWGAQLAVGPYPLDYTPTTTAVVYGPRFDYNPTTLAPLGLLIEEQRTNLVTYSEQFDNAAWTKTRSSITANTIVAPDGALTGDKLVGTTDASTTHFISQSTSFVSGTTYTTTLFAKQGEIRYVRLGFGATAFGAIHVGFFDLQNGVVTSTSGTVTTSITSVGNGWWRVLVTATATATASDLVQINLSLNGTSSNFTGDGTSGLYIWGAQLEAGAFPTSYIPTVASTVTRSADVASINTLSPWYNAAEGALFAEGVAGNLANSPVFVNTNDGTSNNLITSPRLGAAGLARLEGTVGGVAWTAVVTANATTANSVYKAASAFKAGDQAICLNGGTTATGANASLPAVTTVRLGSFVGNLNFINGYLRRISYYPRRLTNAELQVLTS